MTRVEGVGVARVGGLGLPRVVRVGLPRVGMPALFTFLPGTALHTCMTRGQVHECQNASHTSGEEQRTCYFPSSPP